MCSILCGAVGFNNPNMPWSELERRLSWGKAIPGPSHPESRHRQPYEPPPAVVRRRGAVPYAELHCHTNFSFLDGASHPEELVEEAARLGLEALAVTDHDGMYGVVRFAQAAHAVGMPTVFGAELTLDLPRRSQAGLADPEGRHLVVLARDPSGYARLCRTISQAQMGGGEKGLPKCSLSALAQAHGGHWLVLTGCRKGTVPAAWHAAGPTAILSTRFATTPSCRWRRAPASTWSPPTTSTMQRLPGAHWPPLWPRCA